MQSGYEAGPGMAMGRQCHPLALLLTDCFCGVQPVRGSDLGRHDDSGNAYDTILLPALRKMVQSVVQSTAKYCFVQDTGYSIRSK